jgi:hypothetical protein
VVSADLATCRLPNPTPEIPVLKLSALATISFLVCALTTSAATAQTSAPLGISACDELLAKLDACSSSASPEKLAGYTAAADQMRKMLKVMASTQSKASLETDCKKMNNDMPKSSPTKGCDN